MKILSLSNCPLIESQGSGYVIVNFCRRLRDRHHEVDLFGPESYEPFSFLKGRATSYRQAVGMLFFTLRQLSQKKYDIVELYGGESWLTASILRRIPNRKFLLVSHSNGIETRYYNTLVESSKIGLIESPFKNWYQINQTALFKNAFTQVDGIVTVSEDERQYALACQYQDTSHVVAIENSLPDDYIGLSVEFERKPVIGYCGSWIPRKGIKLIQSDITRLLTEFPDCIFKLIGVGYNFKQEDYFPGAITPQIEVIPFVEDKQSLQKIYQSISILIVPSIYESFGLVTAEAMACGCAVVVSKIGWGASLKDNQEALVLNNLISPQLYQAVKKLLLDETLRLKIAQSGYHRVQSLRWSCAVEKLENTYLEWLQEFRAKMEN
jgi:glycosyltransferase involved in cell wall biosynthesis